VEIEKNKNITKLVFPPKKDRLNPYNVFIFHKNKKGFIIDSGNIENGVEIQKYIKSQGLDILGIIFSHYHLDHIGGYQRLDNIPIIIGSSKYDEILQSCNSLNNLEKFYPTNKITSKVFNIELAGFKIQCRMMEGHSPCSIIIEIDNEFLHVGDLIINTEDGNNLLPLGWYELIENHIKNLEYLKTKKRLNWILGHGNIEQDIFSKEEAVTERILYLTKIKDSKGNIGIEEAIKDNMIMFKHLFWHEQNLND